MSAHSFRFRDFLLHRMRIASAPRRPRHPLLRMVYGLAGLALLAVLLVFGVVAGLAMLATGLLLRLWSQRRIVPTNEPRLVDADYRVVERTRLPRH